MQIFMLTDEMRRELTALRAYAEQHPFTIQEMEARQLVKGWAPGDAVDFTRSFQPDTKVVFTVESTRSGRLVRHLSVSINGKMPYPFVVIDLMPLLGFTGTLEDCLVDFSEEPHAISIIQPLTKIEVHE